MTPTTIISPENMPQGYRYFKLTASRASTSVAGLQGLLVVTLAEVVGASMGNDGTLFAYISRIHKGSGI